MSNETAYLKQIAENTSEIAQNTLGVVNENGNTSGSVSVSNFPETQAISATDLPLPAGAAREATLTTISDRTPALGQATAQLSIPVVLSTDGAFATNFGSKEDAAANMDTGSFSLFAFIKRLLTKIPQLTLVGSALKVDNSAVTQPVSGSVSVANLPAIQPVSGSVAITNLPATQAISATALPLPTGAATEATAAVIRDRTPPLGQNTAANSTPVTLATDGAFATSLGLTTDAAAISDTGNSSFISLFKRLLGRFSNLLGLLPTALSSTGRFLVDASIAGFQDASLITEPPLTSVGSTPARSVSGYKSFTYQLDLSNVGTSVTVRMEGNLIGSNYDNLNPSNTDTTLVVNKTYLFSTDLKINNVRMTLVSINGGTPNLQCYLLRGN